MIPALAFMIAAYTVPRIIISTLAYWHQCGDMNSGGRVLALLLCVASCGGILLGLAGVMFAGSGVPSIPSTPGLP